MLWHKQIKLDHRRWSCPSDLGAKLFGIGIIGCRDQYDLDPHNVLVMWGAGDYWKPNAFANRFHGPAVHEIMHNASSFRL